MKLYHYEKESGLTERDFYWDQDGMPGDERHEMWRKQREEYGFDEREIWDLKIVISAFLFPRLRMFAGSFNSYPLGLTPLSWTEAVDKMAHAFERIVKDDSEDQWEEVEEGLDLFRKYFFHLWD